LIRSLLTMLGIVIGVAAVIAMLALGRGAQDAVASRIAALGTTLLTVVPGQLSVGGVTSQTDRAPLYAEDPDSLRTAGGFLVGVEPEMARQLQIAYRGLNTSTEVIGTTTNYPDIRRYSIESGQMFTGGDNDGRRRVAVLGATVVTNLHSSTQ